MGGDKPTGSPPHSCRDRSKGVVRCGELCSKVSVLSPLVGRFSFCTTRISVNLVDQLHMTQSSTRKMTKKMTKKTSYIFAAAICFCILFLNLNGVEGLKANNKNTTEVTSRRVLQESGYMSSESAYTKNESSYSKTESGWTSDRRRPPPYVDRCSCGKCKEHMRLHWWSNFCDREDWCYFHDQEYARNCPGAQKGKRSGKWLKCCSDNHHSLNHSLNHSPTLSLTHSLTHSLILSL